MFSAILSIQRCLEQSSQKDHKGAGSFLSNKAGPELTQAAKYQDSIPPKKL